MPHRIASTITATLVVVLTACGPPTGLTDPPEADEVRYDCFGVGTTAQELDEAGPVADLDDHDGVESFAAATDDLDGWRAIDVDDAEIAAIRERHEPDVMDGEVRDHERLVIERRGEPRDGETDDRGWMVTSSGPCALRAELDGLGPATVLLDPDARPDPEDHELSLLIVEQACASGQPADDRVEVALDTDAEAVRVVVGVRPAPGDQTCPSNPPTPVTVELDEALGERPVLDAGRYPPTEVETADVPGEADS